MSLAVVAVIGSGATDPELAGHAHSVGAVVARSGAVLVCGGLGGVMEAACAGARSVLGPDSGRIVGILPGDSADTANPHVDLRVPTGMGIARNVLIARAADAVIAVGGESGTLSEIAHAWQLGKPVCAYTPAGGWGARLAGESLDDRRADTIVAVHSAGELARWLEGALRLRTRAPR